MTDNDVCKTCKHARWELMKNGRPNPRQPGSCTLVVQMPPVPIAVMQHYSFQADMLNHRNKIWMDSEAKCPTWEAK